MSDTRFNRKDWMRIPEGFPAELIRGELVREPAPSLWHQVIVGRLVRMLAQIVGPDRVITSPISVFLGEHNIVQPDVILLPEETPIGPERLEAPIPPLVVEVLSPPVEGKVKELKLPLFLDAGITEIWLVNPMARSIELVTPDGSRRTSGDETLASVVLPGFVLTTDELLSA